MDEQRPMPPLEEMYKKRSKDGLGKNGRLDGVATAAEGFVSVAAPVRQQQEDNNATEPVEDHRKSSNVPTKVCSWSTLFNRITTATVC